MPLFLLLLVASSLLANAHLMSLTQYAGPHGADGCPEEKVLPTAFGFLFDDPNLCQQTLTSTMMYKVSRDGKTITTYGASDQNCNGTILHQQTVTQGSCFSLFGDNPATKYKANLLSAQCQDGACPGTNKTCCWTPDLPGHNCAAMPDACCCPDFKLACPSGYSCACEGLCPGPFCQCIACFPNQNKTQLGLCNNKDTPEALTAVPEQKIVHAASLTKTMTRISHELAFPTPEDSVACPDCAKFFADNLNNLLDIILQIGVEGNCGKLCGDLHVTPAETAVCELLCLAVGLDEFVKILQSEDLDPVWICKELKVCPVNDCVGDCVEIVEVDVTPSIAKLRTEFVISFSLIGKKKSGTGTVNVQFPCLTSGCKNPVMGFDVVIAGLEEGEKQGFSLKIPTDEDQWMYDADATYPVSLTSCQYDCGDEHSSIYSSAYTNFTILKDNAVHVGK